MIRLDSTWQERPGSRSRLTGISRGILRGGGATYSKDLLACLPRVINYEAVEQVRDNSYDPVALEGAKLAENSN